MNERETQKRFFVVHLHEKDRPSSAMRYEIQVLDGDGRAAHCVYADDSQVMIEVIGLTIPTQVVDAARRQPMGQGDYVDDSGKSIRPF